MRKVAAFFGPWIITVLIGSAEEDYASLLG
jgi:hypothetical protein